MSTDDLKKIAAEGERLYTQMRRQRGDRKGRNPVFPFLLIRGYAGDVGARPLPSTQPSWESPDLLVMEGTGAFDRTKCTLSPVAGNVYTVFVHVWNLGHSPVYGAQVQATWVEPGFFNPATQGSYTPHPIGATYVDLEAAGQPGCHKLVPIPTPWTVVPDNDGHECLLASVHHPLDPWSGSLDAIADRHVAQRNLFLATGHADLSDLLHRFGTLVPNRGKLEILGDHGSILTHLIAHAPLRVRGDTLRTVGTARTVRTPGPRATTTVHEVTGTTLHAPASLAGELQRKLDLSTLTASDLVHALHVPADAEHGVVEGTRQLRFTCTEDGKVVGGYTLLLGA